MKENTKKDIVVLLNVAIVIGVIFVFFSQPVLLTKEPISLLTIADNLLDYEIQEMKDLISMKLGYLKECKDEFVSVKHFIKDRKKAGGMVKISSGLVKRIDEYEQVIVFIDNQKIRIDDIIDIKSENIDLMFSNFGI